MSRSKKSRSKKKPSEEPLEQGGHSKDEADAWQYGVINSFGFEILQNDGYLSKHKARKIMSMLLADEPPAEIARVCKVRKWRRVGPSDKQIGLMRYKGLPAERATCRREAGIMLDALLDPMKCVKELLKAIDKARTQFELSRAAREAALTRGILPEDHFATLTEAGRRRREELSLPAIPE